MEKRPLPQRAPTPGTPDHAPPRQNKPLVATRCDDIAARIPNIADRPESALHGPLLLSESYPHSTTFKRNHDKLSYYFTLSAIPLREHVYHLSRHTRWDAGSTTLPGYRFLQAAQGEGP